MKAYYVNNREQANGDHEVHENGCRYFPSDAKFLGYFTSCKPAVAEAKKIYRTADGCKTCSPDCHSR